MKLYSGLKYHQRKRYQRQLGTVLTEYALPMILILVVGGVLTSVSSLPQQLNKRFLQTVHAQAGKDGQVQVAALGGDALHAATSNPVTDGDQTAYNDEHSTLAASTDVNLSQLHQADFQTRLTLVSQLIQNTHVDDVETFDPEVVATLDTFSGDGNDGQSFTYNRSPENNVGFSAVADTFQQSVFNLTSVPVLTASSP